MSVINGRLVFRSKDDFNAVMEHLHSLELEELSSWENNFSGFSSLRAKYKSIDADQDEDRTALTTDSLFAAGKLLEIPDLRYATILNEQGVFQIGDSILLLTREKEYMLAETLENHITDIAFLDSNPDVLKRDAPQRITGDEDKTNAPGQPVLGCNFSPENMGAWFGWREYEEYSDVSGQPIPYHNGRRTRVKFSTWNLSYITYASVCSRIKPQKKTRFGGWLNNLNANMIMEACYRTGKFMTPAVHAPTNQVFWITSITSATNSTPAWPNKSCNGCNVLDHTSAWAVYTGASAGYTVLYRVYQYNFHAYALYQGVDVERSFKNY